MGVFNMGSRDGVEVADAGQMFARFFAELTLEKPRIQMELNADPMKLESIERKIHELFARGAGLFLTGLIAESMKQPEHQARCEQVRNEYAVRLKSGEDRQIEIRFANGFSCFATTRYCAPIRKPGDDPHVPGIDIELSQFGFSGGDSPALVSKVARATALMPLAVATQELHRDGIKLNEGVIDRISSQAAKELVTVRQRNLELMQSGELVAGNELEGKTISVQIDGARTRIRSGLESLCPMENFGKSQSEATGRPSQGRSKESRRRATFEALWREPKVITIYVHDSQGRKDKKVLATIDGTFGDADSIQAIVAMHLHRLGAAKAKSICFNSDGAKWIWDRIDTILQLANIPTTVQVYRVLDVYHACENLNKALSILYPIAEQRRGVYRKLRTQLRDSGWAEVANQLEAQYQSQYGPTESEGAKEPTADQKECLRVINYIRDHGRQGHMNYGMYSIMGLPLGSGAIESAIRRVVNLRMKSNGIFWKLERAEEMLLLRATVLSNRWDENRKLAKHQMKLNQKLSLPKLETVQPDECTPATSA
jgi:hypothetical protein